MNRYLLLILTTLLGGTLLYPGTVRADADRKQPLVQMSPHHRYRCEDGVVNLKVLKIKVTKTSMIAAGQRGNEHGDRPLMVFWYRVTNHMATPITVRRAWTDVFDATQRPHSTAHPLKVVPLSDEPAASPVIKRGQTASGAVAYAVDERRQTIVLTAHKNNKQSRIGQLVYQLP